jgi:hypothetical protein
MRVEYVWETPNPNDYLPLDSLKEPRNLSGRSKHIALWSLSWQVYTILVKYLLEFQAFTGPRH